MQAKAFAYVSELLTSRGMDHGARPGQAFRTRSSHTARVCRWVERLIAECDAPAREALRLAAAFHDAGYVCGREDHAVHSAALLDAYARAEEIDGAIRERAVFLVREHSNKDRWLPDPDAPLDLVLLMEADLLDEEGAMGLVLDCLSAEALGQGYTGALARMQLYEPERLSENPMITPLAREFWAEKQRLIEAFIGQFARDMEEFNAE